MTVRPMQGNVQSAVAFLKSLPVRMVRHQQQAREERQIRKLIEKLDWNTEAAPKPRRRKGNPLIR